MAPQTATRRVRREQHYPAPVSVRMTADQLKRLDELVEQVDRSRNALIREGIDLVLRFRGEAVVR